MRKKITYLLFLTSIFLTDISVKALNIFGDSSRKDVCGLSLPSNIPTFTNGLFNLLKIVLPIILIIMGMIDFSKAVSANDEKKMKESKDKFIRRLIAAIFIFFIVAIVQFVFKNISKDSGFSSCMNCILNDTCNFSSEYYTKTITSTCVSNCENIKDSTGKSVCLQNCKNSESAETCDTCEKLPTSEKAACLANCKTSTVTKKKTESTTISVNLVNAKAFCQAITTESNCNANNLCKWDDTTKCSAKEREALSTTNTINDENSTDELDKIVNFAKKYATENPNHPYVYGGNNLCEKTPFTLERGCKVDCSKFVQSVYSKNGYSCLSRTAQAQAGDLGAKAYNSDVKLKKGDLLFYGSNNSIGHVTMYIGNGQVVHASSSTTGVIISPLDYKTPVKYASVIGNSKCKKSD